MESELDKAEQYAAKHGIVFSQKERERIADAQNMELQRLQTLNPPQTETWSVKFNREYPKLLKAITGVSSVLFTLMKTILTTIGLPFVLLLVAIVEVYRVKHGIDLFEVDNNLSMMGSIMLVIFNLVVEFTVHHVEHRAGYTPDRRQKWSLRIWSNNMRYRLGMGDKLSNWEAVELSPAQGFRQILKLLTFTILALALAGSMQTAISQQTGAWYDALGNILFRSSLSEIVTWAGGFAFALTAVLGAQALTRYIAIQAVESEHQMKLEQSQVENPHAGDVDKVGAITAMAIINAKLEKKGTKTPEWSNPQDFLAPVSYQNGNGNHKGG